MMNKCLLHRLRWSVFCATLIVASGYPNVSMEQITTMPNDRENGGNMKLTSQPDSLSDAAQAFLETLTTEEKSEVVRIPPLVKVERSRKYIDLINVRFAPGVRGTKLYADIEEKHGNDRMFLDLSVTMNSDGIFQSYVIFCEAQEILRRQQK